jgi:hypothetical protein
MTKKEQPQAQTPELFTVYYMNQDKVFEMRMLLDNRLRTGHTGEQTGSTSSEANINAEAGAKVPFLTELQGNIEGKIGHEKQTRMVDTLEYIHTKSRMLSDIIARCNIFEGSSANEGDLVYIDNVNLELLNEDEVRALVAIMTGTFDGFTVPESGGLDIGHMFQSIVKAGASFKLRGKAGHGCSDPILLKIPIDSGSLFESGYSIDDLLIGKVGVVGICKGKVKTDDLRSSFDYFQTKDKQQPSEDDGFIECTEDAGAEPEGPQNEDDGKPTYIDVLSIIQAVKAKPEA